MTDSPGSLSIGVNHSIQFSDRVCYWMFWVLISEKIAHWPLGWPAVPRTGKEFEPNPAMTGTVYGTDSELKLYWGLLCPPRGLLMLLSGKVFLSS